MTQTLFKNKPNTKPQRVPGWVIKELAERGVPERTARALPFRAAFGKLYALRKGQLALSPETIREERGNLAAKLRGGAASADYCENDLTNLAVCAFALLSRDELARVCGGLANLLAPETSATAAKAG